MIVENNIYPKFKSYSDYKRLVKSVETTSVQSEENKKSFNIKPTLGAALGVLLATVGAKKLKNNPNSILYKFMDKIHLKERGQKTFVDVAELISTAALANAGSVALGSVGKTKEQRQIKTKEAAFQIMNMAIPMLMVTGALELCEMAKFIKKKTPAKIVASFAAMITGAFLATQITNATKDKNEPKRKYTLKDSVANFDDVVATIKLGFPHVDKIIPVSKILPFIYIYCAQRAGSKADDMYDKEQKTVEV